MPLTAASMGNQSYASGINMKYRASGNKIKPEFWRELKDANGLDPEQFTVGRYYPIIGIIKDSLCIWTIDNHRDRVTINGLRLGLKPIPRPDKSMFERLVEVLFK